MSAQQVLYLNYPAAIPVGHTVEITSYKDTSKQSRWGAGADAYPVVVDLDTGIRYANQVHLSMWTGGNAFDVEHYSRVPRTDLSIDTVTTARVVECTLVFIADLPAQQTVLAVDNVRL